MIVTPEDVRKIWNANCGDLQTCNDLSIQNREAKAKAFLTKLGAATSGVPNLVRVAQAVKRAAASPFCNGAVPTQMFPAGFVASFDWFLNPDTLTLIEEGKYDPPKEIKPPDPTPAGQTTSYWDQQKPGRWEPSDGEFLRCQIAGLLTAGRPSTAYVRELHDWIDNGGAHPWASEAEVTEATARVMQYRKQGSLPKGVDDFGNSLKVPKSFKELREKREEQIRNEPPPPKEAEQAVPLEDDPW